MKQTINEYAFMQAFKDAERDQFTYDGYKALFEYFEQYTEDTGEEIELDVIAFCCEYTEYENIEEFHANYDKDDYPTMEDIKDSTTVIPVGDDGFIIADF